jgi:hypothetical protein
MKAHGMGMGMNIIIAVAEPAIKPDHSNAVFYRSKPGKIDRIHIPDAGYFCFHVHYLTPQMPALVGICDS